MLANLSAYRFGRRIIRSSPLLFRLRLRLRRRPLRSLYPTADTDLFITGYPRSANSFTVEWVMRCWPELRVASHMHTIASLKDAQRNGVPTMVLIREPSAAIASALVKRRAAEGAAGRMASLYVEDYVNYYRYVHEHVSALLVVDFETATSRQPRIAALLNREFGMQLALAPEPLAEAVREATEFMRADGRNPLEGPRPPSQRNFDHPEKERKKRAMTDLVRCHARFAEASELYTTLSGTVGGEDTA